MSSQLDTVLDELRPGLVEDGSDLEVVQLDGGIATLRLVIKEDACLECIVPREQFEQILTAMLVGRVPELTSVRLIDPREN